MIYTLEWIRREAKGIASSWNGQDKTFLYEDREYSEEDADVAVELLGKLEEVDELIKELKI